MNFSFGFGNNYINNRHVVYYRGGPVSSIVAGIIIIFIGIIILFFSFKSKADYAKKDSTYIETTATVIDVLTRTNRTSDSDTGRIEEYIEYAPILEYKVNKNTYRYNSDYSTTKAVKDEKIKIKYNPNNPNDIIIVNGGNFLLLLIIGIVFALVGFITAIYGVVKIYLNSGSKIDPESNEISHDSTNNIQENIQQTSITNNDNTNTLNNNQSNVQSSINDLYKR